MKEADFINGSKIQLDEVNSKKLYLVLPKHSDSPFHESFIKKFYKNHKILWAILDDEKIARSFEIVDNSFRSERKFHKDLNPKTEFGNIRAFLIHSLIIKVDNFGIKYLELRIFYDNKETIEQFCKDSKNGKFKEQIKKWNDEMKQEYEDMKNKYRTKELSGKL